MKNIAIIAEYNPLHNGHIYQMKMQNSDNIIVALSGNFTERGDIAMQNKYTRAEFAIRNGASMVVEIPTFGVLSCAEHYARCAIKVLSLLNIVDEVNFGSECGNIDILSSIASIDDDKDIQDSIKLDMKQGQSYPKALSNAYRKHSDIDNIEDILSKPNNILGIEYIKALKGTDILPTTIKRIGNDYNDTVLRHAKYASATTIRENINDDSISSYLGSDVLSSIRNIKINSDALYHMLYQKLIIDKADISDILNISEGIDNRIRDALVNADSYDELLSNIKTKRYTLSRLKRTLLDIALNIKKSYADMIDSLDYVTVLAIRQDALPLLSHVNANIVTRYNDYSKTTHCFADLDIRANKLYNALSTDKITSHQMKIVK